MPISLSIIAISAILLLFGLGQRLLDRLRLNDRTAIFFLLVIIIGSIMPPIEIDGVLTISIGGAIVPIILSVYLLIKCGNKKERLRTLFSIILTAIAVGIIGFYLPKQPQGLIFNPSLFYGLAGGIIAYLFGRSRRGAFVAGVLGVVLADICLSLWDIFIYRHTIPIRLGVGGGMDSLIISGFLAILLAETVGELLERYTKMRNKGNHKRRLAGDFK